MTVPSYRIAICGAGTTGLASAAFLARDGHQVQIFERFAEAQPLGAGFMLQPTGLACLARLGLDQGAIAHGRRVVRLHGETIAGHTVFDLGYDELAPHLFAIGIHRAALFQLLHDHVIKLGVLVTCASEVVDSRRIVGGRTVVDKAGTTHGPFDLVIDATGLRSPLRDRYASLRLNKPYPFGAVWGVVEEVANWSYPHHLRQRYDGAAHMAGILPIGCRPDDDRQLAAVFWSLPTARAAAWRAAGLDVWRQEFLRFWPAAEPFLSQFGTIDELTFATYADIALQHPYADRLLFVGDAAHAGSPQLGQGANLGLIDAMTLAEALHYSDDLQAALSVYARTRNPQTRFYQYASRALTPFFQSHSRLAGQVRDVAFRPMARIPYVRGQMLRTLAGVKTGLLTALDPGDWDTRYALRRSPPDSRLAAQD